MSNLRKFLYIVFVSIIFICCANLIYIRKNDFIGKTNIQEAKKQMKTIDFHTHPIPESFKVGLKDMGIDPIKDDGFPLPDWNIEHHLSFMDKAGIDFSILSLPSPHIHNGNFEKSKKYARLINHELKEIVDKYPDKFGFTACLPLPDAEGALAEIKYAFDELGAIGVKVPTNANGVYLGDPSLDSVFEELNRRKALVIIHPNRAENAPDNVVTGKTAALYEYPTDTTRAVMNMIAHNIMVRYPDIKFVVPHTGSFLPYMVQRFIGISEILASKNMMKEINVWDNLKNLYFDIAGDPEPFALDMLLMITDSEHIVLGTDYPHSPESVILKKKNHLEKNPKYQNILPNVYKANAKNILKNNINVKN